MPKGKSADDDLAVRLDWPHGPAPLTTEQGSLRAAGTNGKHGEPNGLAVVLQRLDALIAQVRALTDQVEALNQGPATERAEEEAPAPPARRPAPRRRST